jgi:hypothetical protein
MISSSEPSLEDFAANGPPPHGVLDAVERHFGCVLPEQYKAFMINRDGGEGFVGNQYLVLWRAGELIDLNRDYESDRYAPGLMLFGSNGGGEAFAFDLRDLKMAIRIVPFIGMSLKDAVFIADDFDSFLTHLTKSNGNLP